MAENSEKVLLVVDDIGAANELPDGSGAPIDFSNCQRLLRIAIENKVRIPVAVTAGFLDIDNVAGLGVTNRHADKIIRILEENRQHLPVWNHGLTHRFEDEYTEFGSYKQGRDVSAELQRQHLEVSQKIFKSIGLGEPDVFVPPAHAWVPGVTDKIVGELGFSAMAIRQFEKKSLTDWLKSPSHPYKQTWPQPAVIETYYRLGLGIPYNVRSVGLFQYLKSRQYISPGNKAIRFMLYRSADTIMKPHHYFAHIQNLTTDKSVYWMGKIIQQLKNRI